MTCFLLLFLFSLFLKSGCWLHRCAQFVIIYWAAYLWLRDIYICICVISICMSVPVLHLAFFSWLMAEWAKMSPSVTVDWTERSENLTATGSLFYLEWLIQLVLRTAPGSAPGRTPVACGGLGIGPSFSPQVEGVISTASKHISGTGLFFGCDQRAWERLGLAQGFQMCTDSASCCTEGLAHTHVQYRCTLKTCIGVSSKQCTFT